MVLPAFGGSPQVWTTSMLFFQVALLVGYGYTHVTTQRLGPRIQPRFHVYLALLPLVLLPIAVDVIPSGRGGNYPSFELLAGLTLGVAAPFVLVATSGPLIQRWFSWTDHPAAQDPYFLYSAGNVGSAVGLISYPLLLEPTMSVQRQSQFWAGGYVVALLLLVACARLVEQRRSLVPKYIFEEARGEAGQASEMCKTQPAPPTVRRIGRRRRLRWIVFAFVPSSAMLAATSHLSTDVAAIPMLWVMPLGVYLLTFSIAFGRAGPAARQLATYLAGPLVVAAIVVNPVSFGVTAAVIVQILFVAVAGTIGHGLLAADRPPPSDLTRFYVLIAVGGALGGVANSLIAPLVFPTILEHPLVAAATLALVIRWREPMPLVGRSMAIRWVVGSGLASVPLGLFILVSLERLPSNRALALVLLAVLLAPLAPRGARVGVIGVSVVVIGVLPALIQISGAELIDRTFYGVHRVFADTEEVTLVHGTTVHGMQSVLSEETRRLPQSYYHQQGPVGDLYAAYGVQGNVGVVGLGSGVMAAYGVPGQTMVFHEIDPSVAKIAGEWFSYIEDSQATVEISLGDGRLTVGGSEESYALLVLDAFTSDAIPIHLLTVEAFASYLETMDPGGVIALHISNRHLDLAPVASGLAEAHGLSVLQRTDKGDADRPPSSWVAFAEDGATLREMEGADWKPIDIAPITWTDSRSSLWSIIDW
jgi:spermidine synthase